MSDSGSDDTLAASTEAGEQKSGQSERLVLSRGTTVGRYVVLSWLGAGAMGVVYAAYDPELDRKVALKLLDAQGESRRGSIGHRRLLREAQALARLAHPNVVTVHDVGEHQGRVFVAMEFVQGRTLREWSKQEQPPLTKLVEVYVLAAHGLQAAHDKGLVHRDFKPDNVMIGDDGRVRVMDFGLARADRDVTTEDASDGAHQRTEEPVMEALLTQRGAMMGTPAYMAPEQIEGRDAGAAADQFALCVSLWEALYLQRPFAAASLADLARRSTIAAVIDPPRGSKVPRWLRRVIERGFAIDPSKRWPSMTAFIDALERGRARTRWQRGLAFVAALAGVAAIVVGWQRVDRMQRIVACEDEGATIAEVWNDGARTDLRSALLATGIADADVTADKVIPWLDAQASAWERASTDACMDADVHETWDAHTMERARWCLDERRLQLATLVGELTTGGPRVLEHAVESAADLQPVAPCRDLDSLARLPTPPVEQREAVQRVRTDLARTYALQRTGAYDQALELARATLDDATAIAWPPLVVAAQYGVGRLFVSKGAFVDAERELQVAYFEAAKIDARDIAADAAEALVGVTGVSLERHAEGFAWSKHAEVMLVGLTDLGGIREAIHLSSVARVHHAAGAYAQSQALQERALAIREAALGSDHPVVATTLSAIASDRDLLGAPADARELYERAVAIKERTLGPDHPSVANTLSNLAAVHLGTEAYQEAKAALERAIAIQARVLGPDHPELANSLNNLAGVLMSTGAQDEARVLLERVRDIHIATLGTEHPDVANAHYNIGVLDYGAGDYPRARAGMERAVAIQESAWGDEHPTLATTLSALGNVYRRLNELDAADVVLRRALAIKTKALGPDHHEVAFPLLSLAELALEQGRPVAAVELATRALALRERSQQPQALLAKARFVLARALVEAGQSRARAIDLAEQARAEYRADGYEGRVRDIDVWLTAHARER